MTKEILKDEKENLKDETLKDEQLDEVAGGAGLGDWFKAIGGTLFAVGAANASLTSGAKGIGEVATK